VYLDGNLGGAFLVSFRAQDEPLSYQDLARLTDAISVFIFGLTNGGPAGLVYGFIICWIGTVGLFCSLAEMASA
jgi:hypothetical protein